MTEQEKFQKFISGEEYNESYPLSQRDEQIAWYFWEACAERKDKDIEALRESLNIERIRELLGYLISMAALHDDEMAKQFADELEDLLPKVTDESGQPTALLTGKED